MIAPVAYTPQAMWPHTIDYEQTGTGHLTFRFRTRLPSEEWLNGEWFTPSITDPATIRLLGRLWAADQKWLALMRNDNIAIPDFFRGFNLRVSIEDQIDYRQGTKTPEGLLPTDAAFVEWGIAHSLAKTALSALMQFEEICLLRPKPGVENGRYFARRKGTVWQSAIALQESQWKSLIDLEIQERGIEIDVEVAAQTAEERTRPNIPVSVQREVWRRDQGRCVKCGSQERLEFDHIVPFSMGGSSTARNFQLLCETCNRSKGGRLA